MTVAAPPRPPDLLDPVERDDPEALEALIEEARQRTRTRRRRYAALALAAAAGVGLYFGLVNGGRADVTAPPADAASPVVAPLVNPSSRDFEAWFVRGNGPNGGGPCCSVHPARRTAAQLGIAPDEDIYTQRDLNGPDEHRRAADLLESVLRGLIAGPTSSEVLDHNWGSVIGPDTRLLGVTLSNRVATIDIASELDESGAAHTDPGWLPPTGQFSYLSGDGLVPMHRLSALVFTATQFPFVDGVRFELDGQPVNVLVGHEVAFGFLGDTPVARSVTREDYRGNDGSQLVACEWCSGS